MGAMSRRCGDYSLSANSLSANATQIGVFVDTLATPGDFSSATTVLTGLVKFSLPGGGVLMRDVGRSVFNEETTFGESGQHQLDQYFAGGHSVAEKLCAALG